MPLAAQNSVQKAVDLNMRQTLPGGGKDLIWRQGVGAKSGQKIEVPVYLLKREVITEIHHLARDHRIDIRTITVDGKDRIAPFFDARKRFDWPIRLWTTVTIVLLIFVIALIGWRAVQETWILETELAELQVQKIESTTEVLELSTALDAENTSFSMISRDIAILASQYQRMPILTDLTDTLDDQTWISELSLVGEELYLSGFTKSDVTEIMSALRRLSWVENVELDGPVSFDSFSRQNRFDLSVQLIFEERVNP